MSLSTSRRGLPAKSSIWPGGRGGAPGACANANAASRPCAAAAKARRIRIGGIDRFLLAEQQGREVREVPPPHLPRVAAGRLDLRERHLLDLQPLPELPVGSCQEVLAPAG